MTPSPRSLLAAVAARWPTVLAWFLAGWLARVLLVRLAGHAGNVDAVWGLLVLPLAVLARLVSYVAIFIVVRDALARAGAEPATEPLSRRQRTRELGGALLEAVLPFLIIYAAWAIIDEDVVAYARASLDLDTVGGDALSVSIGWLSVTMVVVAFGLRMVLERLEERRPQWTGAVLAYLEAVWALVTVLVLRTLLGGVPEWLTSRRMVAWLLDRVDDLRAEFAWVGDLLDGIGPVWSVVSDVALLPLAWLALAGVVFAGALHDGDDPRHVVRVRERYGRLSSRWQRAVELASREVVERWEPVRRVATLAWRAGPLPVATYLLAFAVVTAAPAWLSVGFEHLAGPHPRAWWAGTSGLVDLATDVVVVPLQLAVVAAALSLLSARARRPGRAAPRAPLPAAS
ncbi:hypothetical protein G5V58_05810 [Nocardioides anomalus]|uniref:Uncharacterized protein n=1 Tax=Nocardioides anomalus TaxID=2712223 RepID=A0A6G6WAJ1_9ACTN|nr:hypothetical protein [Nocardioides anomalus]QIG42348.1 hypothetical protein G5V58_05810 [Nocardioides anomalus]